MEEKSPIQKLDEVLSFIVNDIVDCLLTELRDKFKYSDPKEIDEIAKKLEKDGYIYPVVYEKYPSVGNIPKYVSTFDGRLFSNQGGYSAQQQQEAFNLKTLENNAFQATNLSNRLLLATWSAAIVGILVLGWYMFVWFYPHYSDYPYCWIWEK